jgi:hypothetical protein
VTASPLSLSPPHHHRQETRYSPPHLPKTRAAPILANAFDSSYARCSCGGVATGASMLEPRCSPWLAKPNLSHRQSQFSFDSRVDGVATVTNANMWIPRRLWKANLATTYNTAAFYSSRLLLFRPWEIDLILGGWLLGLYSKANTFGFAASRGRLFHANDSCGHGHVLSTATATAMAMAMAMAANRHYMVYSPRIETRTTFLLLTDYDLVLEHGDFTGEAST